ncbi:MAG: hypothetical protein KF718_24815 [Polyangiaceae bacterium]|nr:hypothetical protein [Polyangiaceae bacterium]
MGTTAWISRLVVIGLAALGCEPKRSPTTTDATASAGAPAATLPASTASAPSADPLLGPFGAKTPIPTGPVLAVLAGKGLGPIRLTALVTTVERLMDKPCEVREPTLCRYVTRAADFTLDGDTRVTRIHVHRVGRSAGKDGHYGVFNGAIPPDLQFGMLPEAIQEHLGKPVRVERGNAGAHPATAEQHEYDGMVLEYDVMPSGQSVLGGVRIPR